MKTLSELLEKVDKLFVHSDKNRKPHLCPHDYSLSKFPYGWTFDITNSWQKWMGAGYVTNFHVWTTPEQAVEEFLDYVKKNKINVESLMDKGE